MQENAWERKTRDRAISSVIKKVKANPSYCYYINCIMRWKRANFKHYSLHKQGGSLKEWSILKQFFFKMRKKWVNANCFLSWRWLLAVSPIFLATRAVQNKCNFQDRELEFLAVKHSTAVFSSSLKQLLWMPKKEPVCSCGLNTSASQFSKKRLEDFLWVSVTILYWAAMAPLWSPHLMLQDLPSNPSYCTKAGDAQFSSLSWGPIRRGLLIYLYSLSHTGWPTLLHLFKIISCKGWTESSSTEDYSEAVKVSSVEKQEEEFSVSVVTNTAHTHPSVSKRSWGQLSQWEINCIALITH